MSYLVIDGAQGEGGGQVLRTALTLSILTDQPIELINIRANRNKPGLLRQHLTCVLAAQQICNAKIEGAALGSARIRFTPGKIKARNYRFAIGTAGSTVLVCQTILPVLAMASEQSHVIFEGGTHNGMSPSLCFLTRSYLPILKKMGIDCQIETEKLGFYPAGGGKWTLTIHPTKALNALPELSASSSQITAEQCAITALVSKLPEHIGEREVTKAKKELNWFGAKTTVVSAVTPGPGNSLQLMIDQGSHTSLFEQQGEYGVSAERVAKRCAAEVKQFLKSEAAVEEHLADQLLLPMAIAHSGQFTTTKPSLHTLTNIDVIQLFMDVKFAVTQRTETQWDISVVGD
ncbi:RNA 3'-terminal phosphate cyclase [Pseudoalteromonas piscicida]|uniref:RNA 3'-terminal phosphate cyclase n=1 Tax=Pseudoalteromonas piscicida TaxID=43662 RepID=UPI001C98593D|nr:RNA 3'-terminal phosphate cyclase [Pseudoalteromonas piscicida]QZO12890.1 RNA 3'-terminal phosphate cyclase [Pseudoalteromonas piscicida]